MNVGRVMRWRREYRAALAEWRERVAWVDAAGNGLKGRGSPGAYAEMKRAAEARMALQDRAIEAGRGIYGRIYPDMVRAGPLLTDEWLPSPNVAGVGRRLGRLSAAELEVE